MIYKAGAYLPKLLLIVIRPDKALVISVSFLFFFPKDPMYHRLYLYKSKVHFKCFTLPLVTCGQSGHQHFLYGCQIESSFNWESYRLNISFYETAVVGTEASQGGFYSGSPFPKYPCCFKSTPRVGSMNWFAYMRQMYTFVCCPNRVQEARHDAKSFHRGNTFPSCI